MKKIRFTFLLALLAVVVTFTSCLDSDSDTNYPKYRSVVTVDNSMYGMVLYADNGSILKPTAQSVAELLAHRFDLSKMERALVAFDLAEESAQNEIKPGQTYNIVLNPNFAASIPTGRVIDLNNNAPADTLIKNNEVIYSLEPSSIYAANGYLNANMVINFNPSKQFTMNAAYDSEKDVDVENRKFTMTICYDSHSENSNQQGQSLFSFKLPSKVKYQFTDGGVAEDEKIDVVIRYKRGISNTDNKNEEATFKMAVKDFVGHSRY